VLLIGVAIAISHLRLASAVTAGVQLIGP
jgi:hypothetical protein